MLTYCCHYGDCKENRRRERPYFDGRVLLHFLRCEEELLECDEQMVTHIVHVHACHFRPHLSLCLVRGGQFHQRRHEGLLTRVEEV